MGGTLVGGNTVAFSFVLKNSPTGYSINNQFSACYFSKSPSAQENRWRVCAETMTGCGGICLLEAAQNVETVLPVGKLLFRS